MDNNSAVGSDNLLYQLWLDYRNGNPEVLNDIFEKLMPFSLRVCSKICGKYICENDDEASIARLAMVEALDKYDPAKGTLPIFIGQVIRNRIIDYKRKERKQGVFSINLLSKDVYRFEEEVDEAFFEEMIDSIARKQEIEKLRDLLQQFEIFINELPGLSPQQRKTRQNAQLIAGIIANNQKLLNYMLTKKSLPLKELEENWQINRKMAERYRKYIIMTVLIYINDFPLLQEYILPKKGGRADEN